MPLNDVSQELDSFGHWVLLDGLQVILYYQSEVLRAESWVEGSRLELTLFCMDGNLATGEVKIVMVIAFTMLHAQYPDIEVKASL